MQVDIMKIRNLRKSRKLTMTQAGEIIGCTMSGYAKKERGQRSFSAAEVAILANRFGVPINDLFLFD